MMRNQLCRSQHFAPTLALPRKRGREWESWASPSELFLLSLLRVRGREGEGEHADEVIK